MANERPYLEIQYHSGNIRRGVRYLFLSRKQVRWIGVAVVSYLAFVAVSAALLPGVARGYAYRLQHDRHVDQRARSGEQLKTLVAELSTLEGEAERLRVDMSKIYLAYGFDTETARGKGGYPFAVDEVPSSIFASEIRRGNGLRARVGEELAVLDTFLSEVQTFEAAHQDQVRTTPSLSPLDRDAFVLTSPFGSRRSPFTKALDFHAGIDLAAPIGTEVYAPADGVVAFAGRYPLRRSVGWWRYGNMVALRNGDRFITLFGHCDEVKVRMGQRVRQGEVIATVGNSGWSTNPHLHYEVRRRGQDGEFEPVDPRIYILDHRWRDEEVLLVSARRAPNADEYEPLPRLMQR